MGDKAARSVAGVARHEGPNGSDRSECDLSRLSRWLRTPWARHVMSAALLSLNCFLLAGSASSRFARSIGRGVGVGGHGIDSGEPWRTLGLRVGGQTEVYRWAGSSRGYHCPRAVLSA